MSERQVVESDGVFAASTQQMLDFAAAEAGAVSSVVGLVLTLPGRQEASWVEERLIALCRCHEVLRSRLVRVPGLKEPVQSVESDPAVEVRVVQDDVSSALLLQERQGRVGGENGPLVCASLLPGSDEDCRLVLLMPRYMADHRTLALLAVQFHDGPPEGAEEALQYIDYAAWQGDLRNGEDGAGGREFWRRVLSAGQAAPRLPFVRTDRPAGRPLTAELDISGLRGLLSERAGQLDAAPEKLLAFLWFGFAARIVGAERFLAGVNVDGRHEEVSDVAGPFARILPVAVHLDFAEPVVVNWQRFQLALTESAAWQEFLDDRALVDQAGRAAYPFTFHSRAEVPDGLEILYEPGIAGRLNATLERDRLRLSAPFDDIEPELTPLWLAQFTAFVANALADADLPLGAVSALGQAEEAHIVDNLSVGAALPADPAGLLQHLIVQGNASDADRIAVRLDDRSLSYADLDRRSNQVARALRESGAGPDRIVGVYSGRALETVIAVVGILKAGAAYLPLDPSYPSDRLAFMVADAGVRHILSRSPLPGEMHLPGNVEVLPLGAESPLWRRDDAAVPSDVVGDNLAYVIYTSGSTGHPKGVMVTHANAIASTLARSAFYEEPIGRFLLLSSFSFDSSVAGLFWTLAQGGTLVLPDEETYRDPARVAAIISREGITHYLTLPSLHAQILDHVDAGDLKCVIVAGESCPETLPEDHRSRLPATVLVNEYGPTEATVWCTGWMAPAGRPGGTVPIGGPIPGAVVHILDARLNPCPMGMQGEIYVGGAGVSRGYLQRPGLTAVRFVPDPFPGRRGARLYRTGDLGRWRLDGSIEFLGRVDRQVKIRGHRVEVGEIEAVLRQIDGVRDAAVITKEAPAGTQLIAFVVPEGRPEGADLAELCQAILRDRLPLPMVPAKTKVIDAMPRTPNGKLDRVELAGRAQEDRVYVPPRSELEKLIAGIWQDALGVDRVGLHDNFFELGGHSLLATKLRARIQGELRIDLPLKLFFEGQTVEQFAARVDGLRGPQAGEETLDRLESAFAEMDET